MSLCHVLLLAASGMCVVRKKAGSCSTCAPQIARLRHFNKEVEELCGPAGAWSVFLRRSPTPCTRICTPSSSTWSPRRCGSQLSQSAAAGSELRSSRSTRCGAAGVPEVAERFVHHQRRPEHGRAPLPAPPPIHIRSSPLPLPATTLTDQQSVQAAHCGADPRCALPCVWPQASPNAPRWPVAAFDRRIAATPRTRGRRRLQRSPQLRRLTCIARIASQLAGERGSGGCSRDGGPVPPLQHGRKLDGNLCACAAARRAARRAASFRAPISEAQKAQGGLHAAQAWAERQGGAAASALVAQGLGARG